MRRIIESPRQQFTHFWTGLSAGVCILGLVLGSLLYPQAGIGRQSVTADFRQAAGARPGDVVQVAGVVVGTVKTTTLQGDHVQFTLEVDQSVRLGEATTASIRLSTILGARYVALSPAGEGQLADSHLEMTNTSVPFDLADVIDTGTPILDEVDPQALRRAIDASATQLRDTPTLVPEALEAISRLSNVVGGRERQLAELISQADKVATLLGENSREVGNLFTSGRALTEKMDREKEALTALIQSIRDFTTQLRALVGDDSDEITAVVTQLDSLTTGLVNNDAQISRVLESLPVFLRQLANGTGNGNYMDGFLGASIVPDNLLCRLGLASDCR